MTVPVVTSAQAAAIDRASIDGGNPSRALMQRAGHAAASELTRRLPSLLTRGVAVFAGPGNNGGDAWVVAGALAAIGIDVRIVEHPPATPDAQAERSRALRLLGTSTPTGSERIVVDGLLGTGASGAVRGAVAESVARVAWMRSAGATVVSLDIPSGVDATTGSSAGGVVADLTLSFGGIKRGHVLNRRDCGEIVALDIGLGDAAASTRDVPHLITHQWVHRKVPGIPLDAHKGTRGKLAIVGGMPGMAGAVALAASGAFRSGVGLTRAVVSRESIAAVQHAEPRATAAPWPAGDAECSSLVDWADAMVIGPGVGTDAAARALVESLLRQSRIPVVLDADALNIFAGDVGALARLLHGRNAVLTPHPNEMARLAGVSVGVVLERRFEIAAEMAAQLGTVVLLKGVPTIIAASDGRTLVSAAGSPALATGGSGDVLAGMIGTLLSQKTEPLDAAACAAWMHGRAGELAMEAGTARGKLLDDVLSALGNAWALPPAPLQYPVLAELPRIAE